MDMLEDYLRAVSRLLPQAKRDDIIAELRDEILTRIEVKEGELGRALTADETEQLLRDFGHPIVVAARYRDEPQYIVGPALYPFWIFAVRFAVLLEILISALVFVARVIGGGNVAEAFGSAIGSGLTGAMTLIGFATVAAWLIERQAIRIDYFNTWRVRDLRFLDFAFWDLADVSAWVSAWSSKSWDSQQRSETMTSGISRSEYGYPRHNGDRWVMRQSAASRGVGAIAVGVVFILWWMGIISFGLTATPAEFAAMHVDPGALANIDLAALKTSIYWPMLAYFVTIMLFGVAVLAYPRGVRMRGLIDIVIGVTVMALAAWIWYASPLSPIVAVASLPELVQRVTAFFEHPMPLPLPTLVTVFILFVGFGGFCRAIGGAWEVLTGAPRYDGDA